MRNKGALIAVLVTLLVGCRAPTLGPKICKVVPPWRPGFILLHSGFSGR